MIAGAGDELQGIKRGIMESADVIVINKADGDAQERAGSAARELKNALALMPPRDSGRHPKILLASALTGKGVEDLARELHQLKQEDDASGRTAARRRSQALRWMRQAVQQDLLRRFHEDPAILRSREDLEKDVIDGRHSPVDAARMLVDRFLQRDQQEDGTS
jgi:LAO/AO transport system kinase